MSPWFWLEAGGISTATVVVCVLYTITIAKSSATLLLLENDYKSEALNDQLDRGPTLNQLTGIKGWSPPRCITIRFLKISSRFKV